MVPAGYEAPDLPSNPSVDLDHDHNVTIGLVLAQGRRIVRRDWDRVPVDEGRPHVDVLVPLVRSRDSSPLGNLLVPVGGIDFQPVVVDADLVVGVPGRDGDLERGGEEARVGGGVEGVEGGVLEDEPRLVGVEDCPGDQHDDEEDEHDHQAILEQPIPELRPLLVAMLGAALRHFPGCVHCGLVRWWWWVVVKRGV